MINKDAYYTLTYLMKIQLGIMKNLNFYFKFHCRMIKLTILQKSVVNLRKKEMT